MLRSSFAARHWVWTGSQCCCIGGVCAWGHAIALHSVTQSETGCAYVLSAWVWAAVAVLSVRQMFSLQSQTPCMFDPNLLILDAGGCKPSTVPCYCCSMCCVVCTLFQCTCMPGSGIVRTATDSPPQYSHPVQHTRRHLVPLAKTPVHQPLAAAAAGGAVTRTQSTSISPPAGSTLFPGRFPPTARLKIR